MLRLLAGVLTGLLVLATSPIAAAAAAPPAEVYAKPNLFSDIAVSPNGRLIAMVGWQDSRQALRVYDAEKPAAPISEYVLGPLSRIGWIRWKANDRLLLSVTIPDGNLGPVIDQTRLMSVSPALKTFVNVMPLPRGIRYVPADQDDVVNFLPGDPYHVIVAIDWISPLNPNLVRVDIRTGEAQQVRARDGRVLGWITDADAMPRLAYGDTLRRNPQYFRVGDDGGLTPFAPKIPEDSTFEVAGFDQNPNRLVVISDHEGGTQGLYIYDTDRDGFTETLFKDPRYDVEAAAFSTDGRHVIGAAFQSDRYEFRFFDQDAIKTAERLAGLVGRDDILILDRTPSGRHFIVGAREGGRLAESWWVDLEAGVARSLGRVAPALDNAPAGKVFPVTYDARDGLKIPAYITLPPGLDSLDQAKGLPFVVLPHGGPAARDGADYDWWTQFLVSRGYGVLQPNYRGSTGYGAAFRNAGERQWGDAIQDDVVDGARWVSAQGYADKARMCIVGGSFGGYTALVAAYRDAADFRCAVSFAGVSDLPAMQFSNRFYYGGERAFRDFVAQTGKDAMSLRDRSPALQAKRVSMPVLLMHGGADSRVPVEQSRRMRDELKKARKPHRYVELELGDHFLLREKDRLAFLKEMEAFLAANIGPGT